jgi:hypothetical protein
MTQMKMFRSTGQPETIGIPFEPIMVARRKRLKMFFG